MPEPSRSRLLHQLRQVQRGRGWPASVVANITLQIERSPYPDGDARLASSAAQLVADTGLPHADELAAAWGHAAGSRERTDERASENTVSAAVLDSVSDLRAVGETAGGAVASVASSPMALVGLGGVVFGVAYLIRSR